MIKAVLFDMDGVLVDSEEFICQAGIIMFREKGLIVKKEDFTPFIGMGENRYLGGVAEKYGIPFNIEEDKARAYQIYDEITRGRLSPLAGVHTFIGKCKEKGLKIAVVTSADAVKMHINLREIGLSISIFDGTVNGLEVERKKPFPDIYLKGAWILKVSPESCLVVEDAISGEKSGKAAGCKVLALTTSFKEEDFKLADWKAPDLSKAPEECLNW